MPATPRAKRPGRSARAYGSKRQSPASPGRKLLQPAVVDSTDQRDARMAVASEGAGRACMSDARQRRRRARPRRGQDDAARHERCRTARVLGVPETPERPRCLGLISIDVSASLIASTSIPCAFARSLRLERANPHPCGPDVERGGGSPLAPLGRRRDSRCRTPARTRARRAETTFRRGLELSRTPPAVTAWSNGVLSPGGATLQARLPRRRELGRRRRHGLGAAWRRASNGAVPSRLRARAARRARPWFKRATTELGTHLGCSAAGGFFQPKRHMPRRVAGGRPVNGLDGG